MSKEPELSIKVSVDPVIDGEHLGIDIQNQIDKLNNLPKVKIDPDTKNFGKDLSKQISQNLRAVNRVLKTQLDRMSTNINSLNQVSQELFSGTDFSSNIQSQAEIVSSSLKNIEDHISTLSSMFEASHSTKLKLSGSFSSIEELDNLIVSVKNDLLSLFNDGPLNDDNEFSKTFTAALPSIKKLRDIIFDIEEISDNKTVLKKLGIDGKSLVNSRNNLELLSSLLDTIIDYNDTGDIGGIFDELKSTENISKYFSVALSSLKELDTTLDNTSKKTTNIKKITKIFDRSQLDEISNAYSEALGNLISKQNALNRSKESTINLEDQLLQKTTETTSKIGEQVQNLKSLFSEIASSDIGKQLPAVSEYMKSKAELEASKNIENAKSLSLNVNSSSAKEYEAALKGIKDRVSELSKENAFSNLNSNIAENARAFDEAKAPVKDYVAALDDANRKSREARLPQQRTTGLNVSNIENYSQKVTAIKNDLYALKDTVFPAVYSDINRTYGHLFDDSIANVQSYIDKINEIPAAASSKVPANRAQAKTQHSKKAETIDSTNIKNYAALLNGIQGAMNDMKTTIVPDFDKVLSENGKRIADIGASLVNYVAVLKRGLKAVDQSEKTMADKTVAKPVAVPTRKNVKDDVKKPEVIDLKGKVELNDEDIKRPDPLKLNGSVKIKAADVKIDDVEISKKEFDIKGNLILNNAEIVNAVKEAAGETAKVKKKNNPAENSGGGAEEKASDFDRKAKEAHLGWLISNIGENRTYLQSAISNNDSNKRSWYAGKIADYEKDFEETTRELIENLTEEEQDWIESLKGKKINLNDSKQIDELTADKTIVWPWEESGSYLNGTLKAANMAGFYNVSETDKAKKRNSYEKEYVELIKQKPALIKAAAEAKKQYGEDSDAYNDAVRAKKENEEALRAIKTDRQKAGIPRGIVGGGYSNSPAVQSTLADIHKQVQKRRSELLLQKAKDSKSADDKQAQQAKKILSDAFIEQVRAYANGLKESAKYNDDDASESAKIARQQMQNAFDSANNKFLELLDVLSGDEIDQLTLKAKKELDSANRIVERRIANLADNNSKHNLSVEERAQKSETNKLGNQIRKAQYKYSEKKFSGATDVRAALDSAEEAVAKLANIKLGTEEYAKALEDANNKWREAKHLISDFDGEQRDITQSINNMRNSAQKWLRDITGDTDAAKTLRETVQGLISDIDNLDSDHSSEAFKTGLEAVKSSYTDAKHTVDNYTNDYKDLEKQANDILSQVRAAKRKLSKAGIDKYDEVLSGESKELQKQKSLVVERSQEKNNVEEIGEQASQVVEDVQKEATVAADVIKDKIEQDVVEIRALIGEHAESLTKPLVEEAEKQYSLEEARTAIHDVIGYRDYAVNKETESYTPNEAKRAFNNLTKKSSSDAVEEIGHFTPEEAKEIISSVTEGTTEAVKQQVDSVSEDVKDLNESAKDAKDAVENLKQETENIAKSTTGSESSVSGISTVIDHPTVETDNFEARLAALDKLDHQSKEYKDGLEEIIADWESTNKEIDEAIDNEKKLNSVQEDRQKALDQIRAAIKKNSNNMDRARKNGSAGSDLYSQFNAKQTMYKALEGAVSSGSGVKDWAKTYFPAKVDDINNVTDALREMRGELTEDQIKLAQVSADKSIERSTNKAATAVANLKSQIHDYLETNKKIQNSELAQPFRELMNALNSENAPEKIGELQKQFAELRARSKELGLETESLIDKFEKLFGTHLSTMITMAALHKMQEALRIVYQNVVEIDTAVTELRKVSEYAGKSLEEYMGRATEQAQKLGVSISDYVNSTADWKRLGYSDEDAENLATYSTLLKNVGDNIDDVNTSSSYLISTLQGFGLLADQAEDVVNKIDAVANTQPVTAKDLGEILTRSSAAMSAANNTLEETIALGTAANAVIQDADTVGTTLKSLSMYLRAAKSDAENAGIEVDGMANSVSELRSELKSLTGVDIMLDSKNFKSTYQVMKELSQVWSGLSDITQANVTEMIGGKRNANAVSAILNNFDVAESAMESAANSANVAWEENEKYLDSIQGRLAQLDASFQVLSQDVLSSGLLKTGVSFLTSIVKLLDKIINLTGALPAGLGIAAFAGQLGEPKMTGFMIVPSNTPGGDTEQARCSFYWRSAAREYLVKPTNMVA